MGILENAQIAEEGLEKSPRVRENEGEIGDATIYATLLADSRFGELTSLWGELSDRSREKLLQYGKDLRRAKA